MGFKAEDFLAAMKIISDKSVSNLRLDKTIEGTIVKIEDTAAGKYRVDYNGNRLVAYSENTDKIYSINSRVYVKIPEGDFTKKKFIEGLALGETSNLINYDDPYYKYSRVGEPWFVHNSSIISLQVQTSEEQGVAINNEVSFPPALFKENAAVCRQFFVEATFNVSEQLNNGMYWLDIQFKDNNDTVTETHTLDVNYMPGNQNLYLQDTTITGYFIFKQLDKISQNTKIEVTLKSKNYEQSAESTPTISVKNISMGFVKTKDEVAPGNYSLVINANPGLVFKSDNEPSQITLTPKFSLEKEEMDSSKATWYIEDINVVANSANYVPEAGEGWCKLEKGVDKGVLAVKNSEVLNTVRYKVVIPYENYYYASQTVTLSRIKDESDNNYVDFILSYSKNEDGQFVITANSRVTLAYSWGQTLQNGYYYTLQGEGNTLVVPDFLDSVTILCEGKKSGQTVGVKSIILYKDTDTADYYTKEEIDAKIKEANDSIIDYIGDIPADYTEITTIVEYINKKIEEVLAIIEENTTT